MAGYNGRSANATMDNPQAKRQRAAINKTSELGLSEEQLSGETAMSLGIARSQKPLFPDFPEISDSIGVFLEAIGGSENPDFTDAFDPTAMKSFDEITAEPQPDAAQKDSPAIGLGPNLKVQDIDKVIEGTIEEEANISTDLEGKRGFGWNSDDHSSVRIGSYFKDNYGPADAEANTVLKGERIDTLAINYEQTYTQTTSDSEE